jgi:hypothetical protein
MRIRLLSLFILVVHLALILNASGALAQGLGTSAGPEALQQQAQNVQVVAHIGGSTLDAAVQGNSLYIGEGPSLSILDISFPHQDAPYW